MIDIVFFVVILLVTSPTTTRCDIFLDGAGQTYEICREEGVPTIAPEPSPTPREESLPLW